MTHFCHFNKTILNPIKRTGYVDEGKRAMLKLKRELLDVAMLRRTKLTCASDIQLPPRIVRVRAERLDEFEDDFYQALYTQVRYYCCYNP
jgi:DNA repair protein RAD16